MSQILCSTGAIIVQANNRDFHLLESLAKELTCDGFEFMMYSSWYEKRDELVPYLKDLKETGIRFPVMHCEKHIGEGISKGDFEEALGLFEINCQIANEIGADKMVVHLWDGIFSDANFPNNVKGYEMLEKVSSEHGIVLCIENVVCNQADPMKHWKELYETYPGIRFVFDTKMAAFHSQLEELYAPENEWLWKEGHICHYHVNDYDGGYMEWSKLKTLPIGAGNIDFDRFFEFINRTGFKDTFTIEANAVNAEGVVDLAQLNRQFEFVRGKLKKQ